MLTKNKRYLFPALALLAAIASLSPTVDAQGKGKPGDGGGGGSPCPTFEAPPSDNSIVGGLPGNLDGTFGIGGTTVPLPDQPQYPLITDVKVQLDGKIVLFGWAASPSGNNYDLLVARLNADGSTDEIFGSSGPGYTLIDFVNANDWPGTGAILANGKILAGGYVIYSSGEVAGSVVAQLNDDGTLDASFGSNGKVEIFGSRTPLKLRDMKVQPDGRIVLAGGDPNFTAVRLMPDGAIDTSFGSGGFASVSPVSSGTGFGESVSVAIQSTGRIVVGGWAKKKSTDKEGFALVAFTTSGQLDSAFGSSGRSTAVFANGSTLYDIAVDSSNRIVAVGQVAGCYGGSSGIARFSASGALDTSFANGGVYLQQSSLVYGSTSRSTSVGIQNDGKIVAAGILETDISLVRLASNGALDSSFGPGLPGYFPSGIVTLRFGPIPSYARALAIGDGRIIVAGANGSNRVVARYIY